MKIFKTGATKWQNKHETFIENINNLYEIGNEHSMDALDGYNDTTKGLQQLITEAMNANLPLRALGAGWSWMKIATAEGGLMFDTKPLNTIFDISQGSVNPKYKGDVTKLFFTQCGNAVWELGRYLRNKNLSLKTSGLIATGAHGSAFDFGPAQEFVVGLHIIVSPTRHIWLERKSAPVASDALIKNLKTELVQDDDLFNSALVSMGSFGIIHGVMIETEDLFLLEAYLRRMPYDDSLKKLMTTLDFTNANLPNGNERPYHFAVSINPYDLAGGAYVYSMYKRPYRTNYVHPLRNLNGVGPGDDAAVFVGRLTDALPAVVPGVVNRLIAGALIPYEKVTGTLGEIFDNTILYGKLSSAAIGISITSIIRVIDILFELNKTAGPFVGIFACRFIKKSKAKLAFTKFDYTCILELDAASSARTQKFYTAVWARLEKEKIPFTLHWGKLNELNFQRIQNMYGKDADTWIASRNKLLDKDSMKIFTNPILQQWGLDKVL
jgi:hypothetical protein